MESSKNITRKKFTINLKEDGKNDADNSRKELQSNRNLHTTYKIQAKTNQKKNIKLARNSKSQKNLIHPTKKYLNDYEKNSLNYEKAIKMDNRTYFQYYCSLIKTKHLILSIFLPKNDYNLISIKISLLVFAFSLFFMINTIFFTDATMKNIEEDFGKYDILYHIPQIIYSTLISIVINIILKNLSLSQKKFLILKQEKDANIAKRKSKQVLKNLEITLTIFFIVGSLLIIFFWYFISCFCAVYVNTQIILIEDTFLSFCLSLIYPFFWNLIPGIFRIPALKDGEKNKKCLYQFSMFISKI